MTLIYINEFFGFTGKDIEAYLKAQPKLYYEVVIPKEYSRREYDQWFLMDFYKAIWIGQLFWRLSDDFMLCYGNPYEKGEFSFIIIAGKIKALARVLAFCSSVYDMGNNEDGYIEFENECLEYERCLRPGEGFACEGLVGFLNDYAEGRDEWPKRLF